MNPESVVHCEVCGAEIVGAPVLRDGVQHCCEACARGEECDCGLLPEDDRRGGLVGPAGDEG
jgi:hypothetical protein